MEFYSNLTKGNGLSKVVWYLRQLLPLTYWSKYRDAHDQRHFCIWRMWFGRCFDVTDVIV